MTEQLICSEIEKAVEWLKERIYSDPASFYTESEITARLYSRLFDVLTPYSQPDCDNKIHVLPHLEFPTPFRCDMSNDGFEIKGDEERTEGGDKYKRGHYDLVVLNPRVINNISNKIIKAQDYDLFKKAIVSHSDIFYPYCLFGIEIMFARDPIKYSRGENKLQGIKNFVGKVTQDTNKLRASLSLGFVGTITTLVFIKDTDPIVQFEIQKLLQSQNEIRIFFL